MVIICYCEGVVCVKARGRAKSFVEDLEEILENIVRIQLGVWFFDCLCRSNLSKGFFLLRFPLRLLSE